MRVIDAFDRAVRAVAVSADGRFLAAASAGHAVALWDWAGGELWRAECRGGFQLAFSPDGAWLASAGPNALQVWPTDGRPPVTFPAVRGQAFAGGVAFTPDGRHLLASRDGSGTAPRFLTAKEGLLARWFVPTWQPVVGYDDWPVFTHLAVSPDGDFVAGLNALDCEVRFAHSGGIQFRSRVWGRGVRPLLAFAPDGRTAVYGWDAELHVLDPVGGKELRVVRAGAATPFRAAAFTGSGRHVGTVDDTGVLRLWDAATWEVDRAFDWGAGKLTGVAFTADGLAGVCGTHHGQLVLFDLD